jgi:hypothetical protein
MKSLVLWMFGALSVGLVGCVQADPEPVAAPAQEVETTASDCFAAGPGPHGVVAGDMPAAEAVGSAASACWWVGPSPHGVVADDALRPEAAPASGRELTLPTVEPLRW